MKKIILLSSTALLAALGSIGGAHAEDAKPIEWTLAYLNLNGTIYQEAAQEIPERIKKATNGKLLITSNSSLVAGNRLLEGVRDGIVQISMPVVAYYTGTQPLLTIPSLPGKIGRAHV